MERNSKNILLKHKRVPILFSNQDEFISRPNYYAELICQSDELDGIIGKYEFTKETRLECGLNGCKKPHWHGYVIVTKDRRETHCGKDCGQREFGVSWNKVEAEYKKAETEQYRRKAIQAILDSRSELLERAQSAYENVSNTDLKITEFLKITERAPEFMKALRACIRNGGKIQEAIQVSADLREAMNIKNSSSDFQTIGIIKGGEIFSGHRSVLRYLKFSTIVPLQEMTPESLSELSEKEIKIKSKGIEDIRSALLDAEAFSKAADHFFAAENLAQMKKLKALLPKRARIPRLDKIIDRLLKLANSTSSDLLR